MMKAQIAVKPTTTTPTMLEIEVTKTAIEYDPQLSATAGCYEITDGAKPIVAPNGDTMLHLVFFLVYTAEGRKLLLDNRPWGDPTQVAQLRTRLQAALRAKFAALADDRLDTVLDIHFAADSYVAAVKTTNTAQMTQQQAIYSQKLLAMLGALHDDAMGQNFSLDW